METIQKINDCCPVFKREFWDGKTHQWNEKRFIMESMPTLFHIPFPPMINKSATRMCQQAEAVEAMPPAMDEMVMLFHDPSAFKSEILLEVTKEVPEAKNNVTLSGTFVSKVFDGPYGAAPKFMKEMDAYLSERDQKALDYYVHYGYCPKCAKETGHNYQVFFAKVA